MSISRRRFLVVTGGAAGAIAMGCGQTPSKMCKRTASTGLGLNYCLVDSAILRVAGAAHLPAGQVVLFNLDDSSAVIVARDSGGIYALSAICTHQCCIVTLCQESACTTPITNPGDCAVTIGSSLVQQGTAFICACHGSSFAANGAVLTGPATAPLPSVHASIDGDDVLVDLGSPVGPMVRV